MFGRDARHVVSIISADQRKLPELLSEIQRERSALTKDGAHVCMCVCIYIYIFKYIRSIVRGVCRGSKGSCLRSGAVGWVRFVQGHLHIFSFDSEDAAQKLLGRETAAGPLGRTPHLGVLGSEVAIGMPCLPKASGASALAITALCFCGRLGERFPAICRFIDGCGERGKVYVHCGAGTLSCLTTPSRAFQASRR